MCSISIVNFLVYYEGTGLPEKLLIVVPLEHSNHYAQLFQVSKDQNASYANYTNLLSYDTFQIRMKENGQFELVSAFDRLLFLKLKVALY